MPDATDDNPNPSDDGSTIWLTPQDEADAQVKEALAGTTYFDLETGEDYVPSMPPPIAHDPEADADELI